MLSPPEIIARLNETISHIYSRPKMHGQTIGEVDVALWCYNRVWAMVQEQESEFYDAIASIEENTVRSWTETFRQEHPDASEDDILTHLLSKWKIVSQRLGVEL